MEIKLNKQKKFEYQRITIELIGHVDMLYDKVQSNDFMSNSKQLEARAVLFEDKSFKFLFSNFEKQFET